MNLRDAVASDLPAITGLYGREVLIGTATVELEPPSLEAMISRFEVVRRHDLSWLVADSDGGRRPSQCGAMSSGGVVNHGAIRKRRGAVPMVLVTMNWRRPRR